MKNGNVRIVLIYKTALLFGSPSPSLPSAERLAGLPLIQDNARQSPAHQKLQHMLLPGNQIARLFLSEPGHGHSCHPLPFEVWWLSSPKAFLTRLKVGNSLVHLKGERPEGTTQSPGDGGEESQNWQGWEAEHIGN